MLRRASVLLCLALAACQPAPGAAPPQASAQPTGSAAPGGVTPTAGAIHGFVRAIPRDVADAYDKQLEALLPLQPVPNATVTQGAASATTGADGGFTIMASPDGWLEARFGNGGKNSTYLGPAVADTVIDPISTLIIRKARYMQALGAIAALPPGADVAKLARALDGAISVPEALANDDKVAAGVFDLAIAGSQAASQAVAQLAWAQRTPTQQLAAPLAAGTARVSTLAGAGLASADGAGPTVQLLAPSGVARDAAGNVYLADAGAHVIRKQAPDGSVTTLAGNGLPGFADGSGTAAQFNAPAGLAVDRAGNLYVADAGNHAIRKISGSGVVTTLAGTGLSGFKDGPGAVALFNAPQGLGVAKDGTVYVADTGNHRVRRIDPAGNVDTLAGSDTAGSTDGSGGSLNAPRGLVVDANRVVVADTGNHRIRAIAFDGTLSTLAGGSRGNVDGLGTFAQFDTPTAVALAPATGELVVADAGNNAVRRITPGGAVTTAVQAGTTDDPSQGPLAPAGVAVADDGSIYVADPGNFRLGVKGTGAYRGLVGTGRSPRRNGQGTSALFWKPRGIARDRAGNLYVADAGNDVIRKVTPDGTVSTFAGNGTGDADGPADIATFRGPAGLCFDNNGNMYVTEMEARRIRKIDLSRPGAPMVTTLAGSATAKADWAEGKGPGAHFNAPRGIAYGPDDKLYIADSGNHRIRTLSLDGVSSTYTGTDASGTADGTLTSAIFDAPAGLAFGPDGTLYVTDERAHRLRKITRAGQVSTMAGHASGDADGLALEAAFNAPAGLAVDASGTVFLADAGNHRIRKVAPDGTVTTLAGAGLPGWLDGAGWLARFTDPRDVALGAKGEVYVVDAATARVRLVTP